MSMPLGRSRWCWPSAMLKASSTRASCPGAKLSTLHTSLWPSLASWEFWRRKGRRWQQGSGGFTVTMHTGWQPGCSRFKHLPYSPDLAPAAFFLFPSVKRELDGKTSHPGDPQEGVGESCENSLGSRLCHGLQAEVWGPCKVREDRQQICQEKLIIQNALTITVFILWGLSRFKANILHRYCTCPVHTLLYIYCNPKK